MCQISEDRITKNHLFSWHEGWCLWTSWLGTITLLGRLMLLCLLRKGYRMGWRSLFFVCVVMCVGMVVGCQCQQVITLGPKACQRAADCREGEQCEAQTCVLRSIEGQQEPRREDGGALPEADPERPLYTCDEANKQRCFCAQQSEGLFAHPAGWIRLQYGLNTNGLLSFDNYGGLFLWSESGELLDAQRDVEFETVRTFPAVAVHPNGRWIALGLENGKIILWSIERSPGKVTLRRRGGVLWKTISAIKHLSFRPDGKMLVAGTERRSLDVWSVIEGDDGLIGLKPLKAYTEHKAELLHIAFSADSSYLLSADADRNLITWNCSDDGLSLHKQTQTQSVIRTMELFPKGHLALIVFASGDMGVYDVAQLRLLTGAVTGANRVVIHPSGSLIAAVVDTTLQIWSFEQTPTYALKKISSFGTSFSMLDVVFHPTRRWIYTANKLGTLERWLYSTKGTLGRPGVMVSVAADYALHPTLPIAAVGRVYSGLISLVSLETQKILYSWRAHDAVYLTGLVFSPDGRLLVSSDRESIRVWGISLNGQGNVEVKLFKNISNAQPRFPFSEMHFSPNGWMLASISEDRAIHLWDLRADPVGVPKGALMKTLRLSKEEPITMAFDPRGRWLASGNRESYIRLWDVSFDQDGLPKGTYLRSLGGHKEMILSLSFRTDGQWMLSGSLDQSVRLWDMRLDERGEPLGRTSKTYQLPVQSPVLGVVFHPSGSFFATMGKDSGTPRSWVHVWDVYKDSPIQSFSVGFSSINKLFFQGKQQPHMRYFSPGDIVSWDCR